MQLHPMLKKEISRQNSFAKYDRNTVMNFESSPNVIYV